MLSTLLAAQSPLAPRIDYVIIVRLPPGDCVAIEDSNTGSLELFDSLDEAHDFMKQHILGKLPYQVVELEV